MVHQQSKKRIILNYIIRIHSIKYVYRESHTSPLWWFCTIVLSTLCLNNVDPWLHDGDKNLTDSENAFIAGKRNRLQKNHIIGLYPTTSKVCCRTIYLWKIEVQICNKLRIHWSTTTDMVSVGISKLGLTDRVFVDLGGEDQRRLLQWHAAATTAVACDARRVRWFLHLSTRQRTAHRARDTAIFEQWTPAFVPSDLWLPSSTDHNLVDYKVVA